MIGQTVSHYKILEKLGGGGMGVVYKALDTKLDRPVALKFLPPELTRDPEAKLRFTHEAKAASALDHPNICVVHEIGETVDDQIFICMAYYEGETLKKKTERGPLPLHDAIDIALQLGRGLQAAHEAGMVHRDVKPANIMVTAKGEAKILDFGVAKLAGQAILTKTGTTVGTAAYASPEQARGEDVDRRSDIFSFGVVLYEMITGHHPFRGEHEAAVMYSITNETPEPLARYKADVPDELQRVINKSLAKERGDRYQHIDEMLVDLRKAQQESPAATKSKRKTSRLSLLIGACLAIVALTILAYVFLLPKSAPPPEKSIAVLPFKNLSDNKEDEYFSEGITDDIIAQLSKITDLKVISRTSVMQYKGVGKNVREIGAELAVANVLEGSVRRSGNQVRIVAQLIDARNEGHLWAETYDKEMTEVFAIQSDVAHRIARALQANLSLVEKGRIERKQTENTEAYQLYLKGRFFWNKRRLDDHKTAIGYFNQAIEKDSGYALAYAGLASTYALLPQYGLRAEDYYDKAEAAATRALELDPTLAEAHAVLGMIEGDIRWHWAEAEKQYKQAIELNPNYPTTHQWYSTFLTCTGRPNEALVEIQRAQDLDPLSLIINMCLGDQYLAMRQFGMATEQYQKTIALDPNFPWGYYGLGQAYEAIGKFDKAIASYQKSRDLSGSDVLGLANLGHAYARSGRTQEARRVLDTLLAFSDTKFNVAFDIAYVYAGLGKKEKTFEWLEKSYQERALGLIGLPTDPLWDDFRSDPRFEALLRKIGFPKGSPT